MTTIFLFLCFATVDASNGKLKVTKLKIEKKEKIVFFGGGGGGGIVDSRRVKVKIRESSFDQKQQSCLSIEINYNFFISSTEKAWWRREFVKEYLPFVASNSSLSELEALLEKYRVYRVSFFAL